MTKKEEEKFIEPNKWYTLSEMVGARLFHWCKDIATYRRFILADREARNLLKTVIIGEGRQSKYQIKGKNIINYLVNVEDGTYQIK